MISRWDGRCSLCNGLVRAGTDVHYDSEAKTVQHWPCFENPKPSAESFRLASELGFIGHDAAMGADWPVLVLRRPDRNRPDEPERAHDAPRGLFDSLRSMPASDEEWQA